VGFDRIDRQFKPKKIELECVRCGSTNDVELVSIDSEHKEAQCKVCRFEIEDFWSY